MLDDKRICILIPAYNEENQIGNVIENIPSFIDAIVVINDASTDQTAQIVSKYQKKMPTLTLLSHDENQGCGGALATGYTWACQNEFDLAIRMDGDGQMNPDELPKLLTPLLSDQADYVKGNRFFSGKAYEIMPKIRFFRTAFLSLITKIVSGYWHLSDFQSGFCGINKRALDQIDWEIMYKGYGQPNDLLILLNVHNFRVMDVPIEPIYNIGEVSGIKIYKVIFSLGWLLFKRFFWRLKEKYIIRDFHPLVFFYGFGILSGGISFLLFIRVFYIWFITQHIPSINALAAFSSFLASVQFSLFAMWFDMEANKDFKGEGGY